MPLFRIVVLLALVVAAAPASAQQPVTTTYGPFVVNTSTGTQLSGPVFAVSVATTGTLQVRYNASPGHCSDVRAHIQVDGVERGLTGFLSAGQSSAFVDVGPVSPGTHVVALQGEGRISGCNIGQLVAWGGTMDVLSTAAGPAAAPEPVPGPGLAATLLAFLAGALAFGPWRRERRG